jgi:hypothetical protein
MTYKTCAQAFGGFTFCMSFLRPGRILLRETMPDDMAWTSEHRIITVYLVWVLIFKQRGVNRATCFGYRLLNRT